MLALAPREASHLAPRETSHLAPRETSHLAPREASYVGDRPDSVDTASSASSAPLNRDRRKQDVENGGGRRRRRSSSRDDERDLFGKRIRSYSEEWDSYDGMRRGLLFLSTVLSCVACFILGACSPLIEVDALPGTGMQYKFVDSITGMIHLTFEMEYYKSFTVLILTTFGIPILLFIGSFIIMWDGTFARALDRERFLSMRGHTLLADVMCISTSYQGILPFLCLLFLSFFTTGGAFNVKLCSGFYFMCLYSFISISLLQAMDALKTNEKDEDLNSDDEDESFPVWTGAHLKRQFSSFFPSLPGVKTSERVDTIHMIFFEVAFVILLLVGFEEPLLDIRLDYGGISLERMTLSLRDILVTLAAATPLPVVVVFTMLIVVAPLVYGLLLTLAGILDHCWRNDDEVKPRCDLTLYAEFLRPWVMIDVFCIALFIVFIAGTQTEYLVTSIPDGALRTQLGAVPLAFGASTSRPATESGSHVFWSQSLSGTYFIFAIGVVIFFMRWYWSTRSISGTKLQMGLPLASSSSDSIDSEEEQEFEDENCCTKYVCGKSCRAVVLWLLICFGLHVVLVSQPKLQLESVNSAMQKALHPLNQILKKNLPKSIGNCAYPPDSSMVPQPCHDSGVMDKQMIETTRSTIEWVSGVDTITLTNISIVKAQLPASGDRSVSAIPQYSLDIAGFIGKPGGFLRLEMCPKNHTSLEPILGEGLCKDFLDTTDACCKKNRHFGIRLRAECRSDEDKLSNVQVSSVYMDNITIAPVKKIQVLNGGRTDAGATLLVADRDVTEKLLRMMKENIAWAIKDYTVVEFGGNNWTVVQLLNRIIRLNAPHENFHCR